MIIYTGVIGLLCDIAFTQGASDALHSTIAEKMYF